MKGPLRPPRVGDMRGQGLNTHLFVLTSVVRKITARRLPGPRSRRPSWIRTATVANDSLGRQNRHWGGHPLPTVHGHHGTKTSGRADRRASPHRPARNASQRACSAAGVRRGAQEAQFDDKVARTRREPVPCPRHRLKPMARRVAHLHHVAATTLHDQARPNDRTPLTVCTDGKSQPRTCRSNTALQ